MTGPPGESLVRWAVLERRLDVPDLAVEVATHIGNVWVDVGWPDLRDPAALVGRIRTALARAARRRRSTSVGPVPSAK